MALRILALALSCIGAPAIAGALGALAYLAGDQDIDTYFRLSWLGVALSGGIMGLIVGVPLMACIGLPLHAHLQKRGSTDMASYAIFGGLVGLLTAAALILQSWRWPMSESTVKLVFVCVGMGIVTACVFWLLWLLRRSSPNPPTPPP